MRIPITDLAEHGIIKDVADIELPPNAWSDGLNVKFSDGSVESVNGRSELYTITDVEPMYIFALDRNISDVWVVIGWNTSSSKPVIYTITLDGTQTDRSPATDFTSEQSDQWDWCVFGDFPIVTNNKDVPHYWDGSAAAFVPLPNWDANNICGAITSYAGHIVTGDVTETTTRNQRLILWSDSADPGTIPATWDYTDPTNKAGRHELSERGGGIIGFDDMAGSVYIYRESATYSMKWTGGVYVFAFKQVFTSWGPMTKHCVVEQNDSQWILGESDFIMHNGTQSRSIIEGKVREAIYQGIDAGVKDNCFIVGHPDAHEVWFCYPEFGDTYATRAYTFNTDTGVGSFRSLPDLHHANTGIRQDTSTVVWDDLGNLTWDDAAQTWNQGGHSTTKFNLLSVSPDSAKIYREDSGMDDDGANIISWVEREHIEIPKKYKIQMATITHIWPRMEVVNDITPIIYVGNQMKQSSGLVWAGPYTFDPITQTKIDTRATGRTPSIRIYFNGIGKWRLSSYDIDMKKRGER